MKCVSCQTDIDPKWKHAITQNICPFCGSSILEELLKTLLTTLQDTMEKLQSYPDQLNDWLLSNYSFIKTDSPDLKNYVPKEILKDLKKEKDQEEFERKKSIIKVKTEQGEEEVVTEKVQSDSQTAGFFERAQVPGLAKRGNEDSGESSDEPDTSSNPISVNKRPKPKTVFRTPAEKTEYIKSLKKKIESEGSQAVINETGLATMISPEMLENADPAEVAEMQSMLSGSDIINSGLPMGSGSPDDEDATADRILSMNLAAASRKDTKGSDGGYNAKDAAALQAQVDKARGSGSGGSFSRRG